MNTAPKDRPRYWFPAKRYGYGWGMPITWQGWVVMVAWLAVFTAGCGYLVATGGTGMWFAGFVIVMVAALCAVCCVKGEPTRWRWGNRPRRHEPLK